MNRKNEVDMDIPVASNMVSSLDWDKYAAEAMKTKQVQHRYANGLSFLFITEADGWITILIQQGGHYSARTQAKDEEHALSYIAMCEQVRVPMERLC